MGYGLTNPVRSTVINWSNQTGANGAVSTDFAPVLQLLHPLIGEGQLEQVEQRLSRARSSALPAAPRPAGAYGWPTMALACSADRRTQRATYRAAWFEKGGIDLITGPCVSIFANRVDNPRQHRRGLSASALVEYQARNGGSAFPCASQQSDKPVCSPHNPLRHNGTQRHHHLFDDHKGFYARGLPHSKSFLGSNGAHQARALCEKRSRCAGFRQKDPGWVPGGRKTEAPAVDRRASPISRPGLRKSGRPCSGKVGRPVKPPLLTQSGVRIRQIALAATHLAQISKHAPAGFLESREGMSP
jgi:hypothetical protein